MSKIIRVLAKTQIKLLETKDEKGNTKDKGVIEAYVSIFDNVDLGGDKIIKGAFADSLKKKFPVGCWMHNWDEPIAKTLEAREDKRGLYIKGKLILGVQKGKEAYELLKEGVIDEFSIGYRVLEDEWEEDGTRLLKKLRLYEWSPVLVGMNPDTELLNVKEENQKAKQPAKKQEQKINYIDADPKKMRVKIYYSDGTVKRYERKRLSFKYKTHLKALAVKEPQKGPKVEGNQATLIKLVKQANRATSTVLRIVKENNK
ncbi:MAG: HK97 family phage prohead protease [Desulfobacteraceae bacterium]|nr:MAG: HK97 family phage prohead protease [Desulfobacteraceae bacterium]